jgi:hypothetical protein
MDTRKAVLPSLLAAAALIAALAFPSPARGDAPQTFNEQFPIDYKVMNVCSPDSDEVIQLSGTLHVHSTSVSDGNGGFHVTSHSNWQGVEGTGLTSGEKYRFISRGKSTFNTSGPLPFTSTSTTHNNMVGQATGVIMIVQNQFHITVNASGEVTSQFSHQSAECKD